MKTTQKGAIVDIETESVAILGVTVPIQVGPYVNAIGSYLAAGYDEYVYPSASASNEQYTKLLYWFNYFEEFVLHKQIITYVPRWTMSVANNISDVNESTNLSQNQILMLTDKEDVIVRDNNLQEYYQQRMQNGAVHGSSLESHTLMVDPFMAVSLENIESGTSSGAQPNAIQDTVAMKFIPTKQYSTLAGVIDLALWSPSATYASQPTPIMAGWKYYYFCPYVNRTSTETYNYGYLNIKKMYQFRYPDTRAILGSPTLIMTEAQLAQQQDANYLEGVPKSQFKPVPLLLNMKAEAYAKLSNKDIDTPMINETKKRKQAVDDLITASSSQNIHYNRSRQ